MKQILISMTIVTARRIHFMYEKENLLSESFAFSCDETLIVSSMVQPRTSVVSAVARGYIRYGDDTTIAMIFAP